MKKAALALLLLAVLPVCARAQWDKDVLQYRGRVALSDGKYGQAIEHFNMVAKLDTADYWNFFYRGIAKYNLGDLRGAQQDFDRTVRLNPVFTNGYHYRAITKSRFGKYDDALKDLQEAINLRPGFSGLYFSRAVTYFLAQRFDDAIDDFDKYIRKEPKDPSAYLNRGACQLFLGDTLKALSDYNRAIRLDRFESEGYMRRGRLYAAQGDMVRGIADMDQAVSLDGKNTLAIFSRALMYFDLENYGKALEDMDKVLEMDPGNALTLYNRSLIKLRLNDCDGALDDMDRVLNINPRNILAYYNRAAAFCELGRWEDAVRDYTSAIELYPDFAKAYQNRAYANGMLGRKKESKKDYDTAQRKIGSYTADSTKKYESLIAFDADFARKDFDNELTKTRDIDIKLRPLFRWAHASSESQTGMVLKGYYESAVHDAFRASVPVPVGMAAGNSRRTVEHAGPSDTGASGSQFATALDEIDRKQYGAAMAWYDLAVQNAGEDSQKAMYLLNRAVLKAEMSDFIASMSSNVQTLTLDDKGATRARISDREVRQGADYSDALEDMSEAARLLPDDPYIQYGLGNLNCLSNSPVESIASYDRAIALFPALAEAHFNRGLVLILLKDREKGCISLSRAGELGVQQAYAIINKYCRADD